MARSGFDYVGGQKKFEYLYLFIKIFFFQKAVNLFKKTVMDGMMTWQPPSCIFVGQRKTPTHSLF